MSFEVRPIGGTTPGGRWHWFVYDSPDGYFILNGQVTGDRDEAERAARAGIAIMGGMIHGGEMRRPAREARPRFTAAT